MRRSKEELVERTEMRMLCWICGVTLKNMKRNDDIRHKTGVACVTDKVCDCEVRLRWYRHRQQREDDDCAK